MGIATSQERRHSTSVRAVGAGLGLLARYPDRGGRLLATALARVARSEQQRMVAEWVRDFLAPGTPGAVYARRLAAGLHPNVRKAFLAEFVGNLFFRDPAISDNLRDEQGVNAPMVIALSPSMRCNLRCKGCYAGNYERKDDLPEEVVERLITEAEELGTRVFVVIGGEPFMWPPLLDLVSRHPTSAFMVFTNATLIDDAVADRILELGNIGPAISIEGNRESTDARRGAGTYDKVMAAMDRLRERRVFFCYSATATKDNLDIIISDEFVDLMIEKGALFGWYFAYMPVGLDPDLDFMPSPEERDTLRRGVNRIRKEKPILVADFWGDGSLTGGCLAAGRRYVHINNKGDVEPCVFAHFAVDNIRDTPLLDALRSDFFKDIRRLQPFGHNLLRPCPLIDHPAVMRRMVKKHGAHATHPGAETLTDDLHDGLREYSSNLSEVYSSVWQDEYGWVNKFLGRDEEYQRRLSRQADAEADLEAELADA
jgi:MoaA/NifB/PqqE/SkfB family radical SAM enzyme